jgi:hypothetical protein
LLQWKSNNYYIFWACICRLSYPAWNTRAPYCYLWRARFYKTLAFYFMNDTIFEKKWLNIKRVFFFNFLCNFCLNISHCNKNWGRYGLRVKYPLFLSDFNETRTPSTDIGKIIKYRISWKSVLWEPRCSMRTDGGTNRQTARQTDLTKITSVLRNFANAPRNYRSHCFVIFFRLLCLFCFSHVFSILCTFKPIEFIDVIFI